MAALNGGSLGRKAHRAAAVPKYEYEKHRAPVKAATSAASAAEE